MTTMIHQILVKKLNDTYEVSLSIDHWSNRQMPSYIGITVYFISNQKLHNAILASRWSWLAVRSSQQFWNY